LPIIGQKDTDLHLRCYHADHPPRSEVFGEQGWIPPQLRPRTYRELLDNGISPFNATLRVSKLLGHECAGLLITLL